MEKLRIYEVKDDYISFLKTTEERVYDNKQTSTSRKYVGPFFEIKGVKFYAPMSSPKESDYSKFGKRANTLSIIRMMDKEYIIGTIRLSHMIPVLEDELVKYDILQEKDISYQALLFKQLEYILRNQKRIIKNALVLKKQKENIKKYFKDGAPKYLGKTFDFEELAKVSSRFTAYKNDLARKAVLDLALEKKEFNKGNRFEEVHEPVGFNMKANEKSLQELLDEELKKGDKFLKQQGIKEVQVGFDYDDYYPIDNKSDEFNLIEDEEVEENIDEKKHLIEIQKEVFEDFDPYSILDDDQKNDEQKEEINSINEEKVDVANEKDDDELFKKLTKSELSSKMISTKALSNILKTIKFKNIKTTSIVGSIFKVNEVLYEMVDYSPLANVALLKNLDEKKVILAIDFPKKGGVDWSEEKDFGQDMWRALVEFNKLNS